MRRDHQEEEIAAAAGRGRGGGGHEGKLGQPPSRVSRQSLVFCRSRDNCVGCDPFLWVLWFQFWVVLVAFLALGVIGLSYGSSRLWAWLPVLVSKVQDLRCRHSTLWVVGGEYREFPVMNKFACGFSGL